MKIRIISYNIHKGVYRPLGHWQERLSIYRVREKLQHLNADLIFLQEVQGLHARRAQKHANWPAQPHYEFLAQDTAFNVAYGQNLIHRHGDHGNVLLSRFPILHAENIDVSDHPLEKRGLLHCVVDIENIQTHCLVVHFGLFAGSRQRQCEMLINYILETVPMDAPLIIAGDFNDWRNQLNRRLQGELKVREVFHEYQPPGFWRTLIPELPPMAAFSWAKERIWTARSFPSALPWFRLDRIYQRRFCVHHAAVQRGAPWKHLSDHCLLSAELELIL